MKRYFLLIVFLCSLTKVYSQSEENRIRINKLMPFFSFDDIQYFKKSHASKQDFLGKWLILDFWNQYCTACVTSMPKNNKLQKQFADKIQLVLVGYIGSQYSLPFKRQSDNETIRKLYEKVRRKYDMEVPIAYDSTLFHKLKISATPYIIIIDPKGIVREVTYSIDSTSLNKLFSQGKQTDKTIQPRKYSYKTNLPFLTYNNGNVDTSYLYRSLLSKWHSGMPIVKKRSVYYNGFNGRFEVLGVPLKNLFEYAYAGEAQWLYDDAVYGNFFPEPLLELKDTTPFQFSYNSGDGLFCYSLSLPREKASTQQCMEMMQRDLKNYFDYDVVIETRRMPYWKLVATPNARQNLKSKTDSVLFQRISFTQLFLKGQPVSSLVRMLTAMFQDTYPFIDETGIEGNIDIAINGLLTDFNDFKRALNENGLDLVKGEKEMKVIVIRDPKK